MARREMRAATPASSPAPPRSAQNSLSRAQRLVGAGLAINTAGSTAVAARASRRGRAGRPTVLRALYLAVGGAVVSVVYLRSLRRA